MHWRTETTAHSEIERDPEGFGIATGATQSVLRRLDGLLDTQDHRVIFRKGGGMAEAIAYLRLQPGNSHLFKTGAAPQTVNTLPKTRAELVRQLDRTNNARPEANPLSKHKDIGKVTW